MYRFLLQRRWLGFLLLVVVVAAGCVRLGLWQLERFNQRQADNARVASYVEDEPVPVEEVLSGAQSVPSSLEWRRVSAEGTYDEAGQVIVRYQSREGSRGVEVVTPLVTSSGTAVLVDRGWIAGDAVSAADVPAAPPGTVIVTGWLRSDSQADAAATRPQQGQVRAISSAGIASTLDYPLYPGYVALTQQVPAETRLEPAPPPDVGQGPHFFYGLQWFFFAALAVFGWLYFAWVEAHPRRRRGSPETDAVYATSRSGDPVDHPDGQTEPPETDAVPATSGSGDPGDHRARRAPPSTGSMAPEMNDAAGESRNAAALPNSSGRP